MAQQVNPFLGLIPRQSFSEEHIKRVSTKIEDIKKTSMGVVEFFHLINRGAEFFNAATSKQIESLEQCVNADMNEDKKFYLLLSTVFKAIALNFNQFGNGLEASLKEYHVATNVELDELSDDHHEHATSAFRKYRQRQDQLLDSHKRYLKFQKTFNDSLQLYKLSLSDVKLIYNKEETLRRYQQCESNFKNIIIEEQSIQERSLKCSKDKRQAIYAFNSLGAEFKTAYQFVGEKIVVEAKNIMTLFCSLHKLVVSDIATKKKSLEQTRIGTFLDATPDFLEASRFFKPDTKHVASRYPIFLQCYEHIKDEYLPCFGRWLNDYQNYLREKSQTYQKILRRIYGYLVDQTRGMEKMSLFLIKDVPQTYDKLKKRLQELIGNKSVDFIRCVNSTLELSMRVYEKLIKVLNTKLEIVDKSIQEQTRLCDLFFKELAKQIDPLSKKGMNEETLYQTLTEEQRREHRESVAQKSQIIKHFLSSFGEKFAKNTELMRSELVGIVNQMFVSFNEIYLYSTEYQETYFGLDFEDGLKRCRTDMDTLIEKEKVVEVICPDMASEEVVIQPAERFKMDEYRAIRKPSTAQDIDLMKQEMSRKATQELKNSLMRKSATVEQPLGEMDPKEKRYFEFLKQKVNMDADEKLVKFYSCALYDKIILQGKLYVTSGRICFHSYFNAANLFFGSTFLQIPKKDIVKIEKRFNAIIFDNSLAITTVNGEVFFTSFFKRDEAYKLIRQIYELPEVEEEESKEEEVEGDSTQQKPESTQAEVGKPPSLSLSEVPKNEEQQKSAPATDTRPKEPTVVQMIQEKAPIEKKMEDGISQDKQTQRRQSFSEVESKKYKKIFTGEIPNTSCMFILRHFVMDAETSVGVKKYPSFSYLYKETSGSKDIKYEKWIPPIKDYLTEDNIKENTPVHFTRRVVSSHPLPKTSIPFMPKFCDSHESFTLHLISKDKFLFDTLVQNKGAPYTDSFRLHTRTKYENTPAGGVEITWYMEIEFLKSVMIKAMIETQTTKEFTDSSMKFFKFLSEKVKAEEARQHKLKEKLEHIRKENSTIEVTVVNVLPPSDSQAPEVEKPILGTESPIKELEEIQPSPQPTEASSKSQSAAQPTSQTQIVNLTLQNNILKALLLASLLLNLILWLA